MKMEKKLSTLEFKKKDIYINNNKGLSPKK